MSEVTKLGERAALMNAERLQDSRIITEEYRNRSYKAE